MFSFILSTFCLPFILLSFILSPYYFNARKPLKMSWWLWVLTSYEISVRCHCLPFSSCSVPGCDASFQVLHSLLELSGSLFSAAHIPFHKLNTYAKRHRLLLKLLSGYLCVLYEWKRKQFHLNRWALKLIKIITAHFLYVILFRFHVF